MFLCLCWCVTDDLWSWINVSKANRCLKPEEWFIEREEWLASVSFVHIGPSLSGVVKGPSGAVCHIWALFPFIKISWVCAGQALMSDRDTAVCHTLHEQQRLLLTRSLQQKQEKTAKLHILLSNICDSSCDVKHHYCSIFIAEWLFILHFALFFYYCID